MNEPEPAPAPETPPPAETTTTTTPAATWAVPRHGVRTTGIGGRVVANLILRTTGTPNAADAVRAHALKLGTDAVQNRFRAAVEDARPRLTEFLRLRAEAASLSAEERGTTAKLAELRIAREALLHDCPAGVVAQIARLDGEIRDLEGNAAIEAAVHAAAARARSEALAMLTEMAAEASCKEHVALRRRRDEIVAALPALLSAVLFELASIDRAQLQTALLPHQIEAALDALASSAPPDAAPAVSLVMQAEAGHFAVSAPEAANTQPEATKTAPEDVPAVEATPEAVSEPRHCEHAKNDGQQCRGRALPGSPFCVLHRRSEAARVEEPEAVAPAVA